MSTLTTTKAPSKALSSLGLNTSKEIHYQLLPEELTQQTIARKEAVLNDTGALVIKTGEFTGRSPEDKFIVKDDLIITINGFHILT